jgi:hypothetical protein
MLPRIASFAAAALVEVLVGASAWAMAASSAPGDLDRSFGRGGYVRVQTNAGCLKVCVEFGGSYADAVALQPDGGIVLGGYNDYIIGGPRSWEGRPVRWCACGPMERWMPPSAAGGSRARLSGWRRHRGRRSRRRTQSPSKPTGAS